MTKRKKIDKSSALYGIIAAIRKRPKKDGFRKANCDITSRSKIKVTV